MPRPVLRCAVPALVGLGVSTSLVIAATASAGPDTGPATPPAWNVHAAASSRVVEPMPEATGPPRRADAPGIEAADRGALVFVGNDGERITPNRIASFLEDQGSPLAAYADVFVEAGIDNGVDPRLIVAISGIESEFGLRQIGHNAWGWGIYGDQVRRFPDWATAIRTYTAELGARYDTDDLDAAFARRYCPPNWEHWYAAVSSFFAAV